MISHTKVSPIGPGPTTKPAAEHRTVYFVLLRLLPLITFKYYGRGTKSQYARLLTAPFLFRFHLFIASPKAYFIIETRFQAVDLSGRSYDVAESLHD